MNYSMPLLKFIPTVSIVVLLLIITSCSKEQPGTYT